MVADSPAALGNVLPMATNGSREQSAKAAEQPLPPMTRADAQTLLDTERKLDRADAALDALLLEAQQASDVTRRMRTYLEYAGIRTAGCRGGAPEDTADLLCQVAVQWVPATQEQADSLFWAVGQTRAHLERIRDGWRDRLEA